MVLFGFNRFMYFFNLFSSFYVSYVLSISSSSSFHRQCKLEGGKYFLSMSTCQTLTSRYRYPIVNCSEVLFVENKMNKQAGKCVRIRAGTHLRHQLTFRNHANVMYRWSSEIACNELTQNWTEPHNIKTWEKITPIPSLDWKQDSKHGLKGNMLFLTLEMLLLFAIPILFVCSGQVKFLVGINFTICQGLSRYNWF